MASVSRQNIAAGGIFDLPKVSYSDSTRKLLKDLLQEAAVSAQHQRQIERWVDSGGSLPQQGALTASSQNQTRNRPSSTTKTPHLEIQAKRSHATMKEMGLYELNSHYVPPAPKYGPGSKELCQELMAFGREGAKTHPTPGRKAQGQTEDLQIDRFDELVNEMEERVQWLEAMEAAGAGEKYRHLIATQLSLKLRDLELLDQERARELKRRMRGREKSKTKNGKGS
ncbi:UPF0193 protein EVG1 homolog [Macrobrachium rosenbergii]|uniref:UPF0193 protein EVG1 homolog n=1 Tax=Macrobrachium rosenbergii TaxID=79674 RepID=UPI0034D68293